MTALPAELLDVLPPDRRDVVEALERGATMNRLRLDWRDEAVRDLAALLPTGDTRRQANQIAPLLRDPPPAGTRIGAAARNVLALNRGAPLGVDQLDNVLSGLRSG